MTKARSEYIYQLIGTIQGKKQKDTKSRARYELEVTIKGKPHLNKIWVYQDKLESSQLWQEIEKNAYVDKKYLFYCQNYMGQVKVLIPKIQKKFYTTVNQAELELLKKARFEGSNSLRIHGKGNKVRYVFVPDFLVKHFKFGSPRYLFVLSEGKRIDAPQVRKTIQKRVKLA
ncbi:3383_t:CDS:2, partial [Entrophospora sp. SA101]